MIGQSHHQFLFLLIIGFVVVVVALIVVVVGRIDAAAGSADGLHGELDFLFRRLDRLAHLSGHLAASARLVALVDYQSRRKVNHIRSGILIQIFLFKKK